MILVSEELRLAFNGADAKRLVLTFDDGTVVDNSDIAFESMELEQSICEGQELHFGNVSSASFKTKIKGTTKEYKNLWFNASIWSGEHEMPLGRFFVYSDKATSDRQYREIVAYDKLFLAMNEDLTEWYNGLSFPITVKQFRESLFNHLGIEQEEIELPCDFVAIEKNTDGNGLTGQEVIRALCEMNACFGVINHLGKFRYVRMRSTKHDALYPSEDLYPGEDVYPDDLYDDFLTKADYYQGSLTYEEFDTKPITKVIIRENTDDVGYSVGDEGNTYVIENNFLLSGAENDVLDYVANEFLSYAHFVSYTPATIKCKGVVWREVGDLMHIVATDRVLVFPILHRVLSGIVALKDNYEARGTEVYGETQTSGVKADLKRLKSRTNALTRTLDETISEITRVETQTNQSIENLQQQIDGAIEEFSGVDVPTLDNYPANEWTTDEIRDSHIGDLYLVSDENEEQGGFYYRFQKSNGVYSWVLLKDNEVAKALEEARKANEAAQKVAQDLETTTATLNSKIEQTAADIKSTVSAEYETKTSASTTKTQLQSQINQNATNINLKVSSSDLVKTLNNQINIGTDAITFSGNKLIIDMSNMTLDANGNVTISGVLKAGDGSSIGGMRADANSIFGNGSKVTDTNPSWSYIKEGFAFMCPGGTSTKISLGNSTKKNGWVFGCYPNFGVTKNGSFHGAKAYFNSISGNPAEVVVTDVNGNTTELTGESIQMSYGGGSFEADYRASGVTYNNLELNGTTGEITLGGTTLTEDDLIELLELIGKR